MEQKREMVMIWIHAKCASEEDERLEPIFYSKEQSCQYCGVYGKVFLYEKGSERVLVADERGDIVGEGEVGESIIVMPTMILEQPTSEEAIRIIDAANVTEHEIIKELAQEIVQEQEATAEVVEETVAESGEGETEAETATEHNDAVDNTTLTRLEQMKEQVAELERQIEENSTD